MKKDSTGGDVLAVYRYDNQAAGDGYVTLINFSSDETAAVSLVGDPELLGQEWNTGIIAVNSDGQAG